MGNNPYGQDYRDARDRLWAESGGVCHWCGVQTERDVPVGTPTQFTADHLIAVVDGGDHSYENLVAACFRCNSSRGNTLGNSRAKQQKQDNTRYYEEMEGIEEGIVDELNKEKNEQESNVALIFGSDDPRALSSDPLLGRKCFHEALGEYTYQEPRLMTPSHPERAGSLAGEMLEWSKKWMKFEPFEHQKIILERMLEVDGDGDLLHDVVLSTQPRQTSKTWTLSAFAAWRMHQAERWGEPQVILHIAQQRGISRAAWIRAAQILEERSPHGVKVRYSNGTEAIELPDGSMWRLSSANVSSQTGLSVSFCILDEVWCIETDVYENGAQPTLAMRRSSQTLMTSTAGDSRSDLMAKYRQLAIDKMEDPERGIALAEWSAAPDADVHDPATWKAAQPFWNKKREKVVRQAHSNMEVTAFQMQFMNRWVSAQSAWLMEGAWKACETDALLAPTTGDRVLACEVSVNGLPIGAVETTKTGRDLFVRSWTFDSYAAFYEWLPTYVAQNPTVEIIHHEAFRFPEINNLNEFLVRSWYGVSGFGPTREAILEGHLRYEPNAALTEQVLSAVPHHAAEGKSFLSQAKSPIPIYLARAMVWTVARLIDPERPMRAGAFAA